MNSHMRCSCFCREGCNILAMVVAAVQVVTVPLFGKKNGTVCNCVLWFYPTLLLLAFILLCLHHSVGCTSQSLTSFDMFFQMQNQSTWWPSNQSQLTMWRNTAQVCWQLHVGFKLINRPTHSLTLYSLVPTGKVNLEKPLHLVIGSISPTAVLLSWGNYLKTPYEGNIMNECLEDGWLTSLVVPMLIACFV